MPNLTPKQQRFVEEYLVDLCGAKAAIRAGYSKHTAKQAAYDLLEKPHVQEALLKAREKLSEKTGISQQWVLDGLRENVERAMQAEPVLDAKGEQTGEYTYNGAVANRALELIGKHLGMFVERQEVGKPGAFENLSNDELDRELDRLAAQAGIGLAASGEGETEGKTALTLRGKKPQRLH